MQLDLLANLNRERAARRAVAVVTTLETGLQRLVREDALGADPMHEALAERLRLGRSGLVEFEGQTQFVAVHVPPIRLIVIGAVHISQALAPMARLAEMDMTVIDPRSAFAAPERFADCTLLSAWPEDALSEIPLDRFTALAALTHDPKIDDAALAAALRSGCFYVGALGSRKTHASRLNRLAALGLDTEALARIHAPIGLDIGAVSPAEIAVSILGQIVLALRRKPTRTEAGRMGALA